MYKTDPVTIAKYKAKKLQMEMDNQSSFQQPKKTAAGS